MKKIIMMIIIAIIFYGCISTEVKTGAGNSGKTNQSTNSLDFIKNGEYAFYLDKSDEISYYRGYMKYASVNKATIFTVRNINVSSGEEEIFVFSVFDDEDGYPTIIDDIIGQFSKISTRQAIPDFINFSTLYLRTQNNYKTQGYINDDWGNFILVFNFNKELPVFRIDDIKIKGEEERSYYFLSGGILEGDINKKFSVIDPRNF